MHASYLSDYWIFLLIGFCVFVYLFFDISYIGYVSGRFRWPFENLYSLYKGAEKQQ